MYKHFLFLTVFLFLLSINVIAQKNKPIKNEQAISPQVTLEQSLDDLSKQISDELTASQKTAVAVTDFVDLKGEVSDLGRFLSEELITRLYKTKKLEIVERQLLNKVIAEQKLSLTDVIEASSAKRIGRILGVDAIVSGTISPVGSNFRINARIINTETGKVLAAAAVSVPKNEEVCSLVNCNSQSNLPTLTRRVPEPDTITNSNTNKTVQNTGDKSACVPSPSPEKKKTWKVDTNFFTWELQNCRKSGNTAICQFSITNNNADDKGILMLDHGLQVFDNLGNKSVPRRIKIANGSNEAKLISGVPVKAILIVDGLSAEATEISKLSMDVRVRGGAYYTEEAYYTVEFRKIPLL